MEIWIEKYNNGASPYEIAEEFNTYPNKVRRFLKKHVVIRSKGQAQSLAMKSGRKKHPTEGKIRSSEERAKISEGINDFWDNISDNKYKEIVKIAKKNWKNRSSKQKAKMSEAAHVAIRKAAKEGSKAELYVCELIQEAGWEVVRHRQDLIKNHNLEIDLHIPSLSTIIEIDGPSHFLPIWGDEALQKTIKADNQKSGLILQNGMVLIRVKYLVKNLTKKTKRAIKEKLISTLKQIENNFPDKNNRFIEIEVS